MEAGLSLFPGQHLNAGGLDDLGDPDAEVVLNDHHLAPGNALAVDEQVHLIARQLIQHHQGALGKGDDVL